MFCAPLGDGMHGLIERCACRSQRVFDAQRNLIERVASDYAVGLQLAKLLEQNLFADPGHAPAKRAETSWPKVQLPKNRRFPLAGDNAERVVEAACACLLGPFSFHTNLQVSGYICVSN